MSEQLRGGLSCLLGLNHSSTSNYDHAPATVTQSPCSPGDKRRRCPHYIQRSWLPWVFPQAQGGVEEQTVFPRRDRDRGRHCRQVGQGSRRQEEGSPRFRRAAARSPSDTRWVLGEGLP